VVKFYAQRDTRPDRWYPQGSRGQVRKFDDLPDRCHPNVVTSPPFGGRPGDRPRLNSAEVADVVAFLRTLDDGWRRTSYASSLPLAVSGCLEGLVNQLDAAAAEAAAVEAPPPEEPAEVCKGCHGTVRVPSPCDWIIST